VKLDKGDVISKDLILSLQKKIKEQEHARSVEDDIRDDAKRRLKEAERANKSSQ
jgi:hypothetical protein